MFGKTQQQYPSPPCACGSVHTYGGQHGLRMGGVAGLKGAALDFIGGNLGQEVNEAFEKKLMVEVFICENCGNVEFRYLGGL